MKRLIILIAILAIVAIPWSQAIAQLADTPWPMFMQNVRHTGRSQYVGPDTCTVDWTYTLGGSAWAGPTIGLNGMIYVTSDPNNLYSFFPDGSAYWMHSTSHGKPYRCIPAVGADGTIYVGTYDHALHAINPDGTEDWVFTIGGSPAENQFYFSSPAIGPDGTIYATTHADWNLPIWLYAINPNGTEKWHYGGEVATGGSGSNYGNPALGDDGTIYIASRLDGIIAVDPADGSEIWRYCTGSKGGSCSIGADGTIYSISGGDLYAINPDSTFKWVADTSLTYTLRDVAAIGSDGTLYTGTNNGVLFAFYPADGSLKWVSDTLLTGSNTYIYGPSI